MKAFVNDGRWLVFCADPNCAQAERDWGGLRFKKDGTPYGIVGNISFCGNCRLLSDVSFPADRDRITEVLSARPVPETRNWMPGETVEDLIEENAAHGVD